MDVGKEREQERKLFRQSGRRKHQFSLALKPAYSGLRRDVYNDKHWSVGTINEAHQAINFVFFVSPRGAYFWLRDEKFLT